MEDYQQIQQQQQQQGGRASNKIRDIVRLQQLLKKWKKLATVTPSASGSGGKGGGRSSVPRGSFAVYVGEEMRRFVIPTEYLGHWAFAELLREAEEEFGFQHEGALRIPCDVEVFEGILRLVQGRKKDAAAMCDCSCSSETEILCR
jgi:SAUR family protein